MFPDESVEGEQVLQMVLAGRRARGAGRRGRGVGAADRGAARDGATGARDGAGRRGHLAGAGVLDCGGLDVLILGTASM
jgi:hypothetical protein